MIAKLAFGAALGILPFYPSCHTANADQLCADTYLKDLKQFPEHALDSVNEDGSYIIPGTQIAQCRIDHSIFGSYDHCAHVRIDNHDVQGQENC